MKVLIGLHRVLEVVGKGIAQLFIIALCFAMYIVPIFATLLVSLFAAVSIAAVIGGGTFVWFLLLWPNTWSVLLLCSPPCPTASSCCRRA